MKHMSGAELAAEMGIPASKLATTLAEYSAGAVKNAADGKPDKYDKIYFSNTPYEASDSFNVAMVGPTVHYTMGGVSANHLAEVCADEKLTTVVPGLFAAGEVIGGIHGENRLGGSSLLDCVVYGRISGKSAAKYMLNKLARGETTAAGVSARPVEAAAAVQQAQGVYTMAEVEAHKGLDSLWVAVSGGVYDVTNFLDDHPGGKKAITIWAGKDATEPFNMMHGVRFRQKVTLDECH
jgi:succinate dehydrogenase/fumarate reductase flavoprotein subunit